jgi:hypothetical protein
VIKESVLKIIVYHLAREKRRGQSGWFRSLTAASGTVSLTLVGKFIHLSTNRLDLSRMSVNHPTRCALNWSLPLARERVSRE